MLLQVCGHRVTKLWVWRCAVVKTTYQTMFLVALFSNNYVEVLIRALQVQQLNIQQLADTHSYQCPLYTGTHTRLFKTG
jgi:hypothetical protein